MSHKLNSGIAVRSRSAWRDRLAQKWSRGQLATPLSAMPPCFIGMETKVRFCSSMAIRIGRRPAGETIGNALRNAVPHAIF